MKLRSKHELPHYAKIPNKLFDIKKMQSEVLRLESNFVNVIQANQYFCTNNSQLVHSVYDNFDQISLTTLKDDIESPQLDSSDCLSDEKKNIESSHDKIKQYRMKTRRLDVHPALDERNYFLETPIFATSYFKEVVSSFHAKAIRVRLTRLKSQTNIPPHIDYDPQYAVRIIVPIFSNPDVINESCVRGTTLKFHLPCDGCAYFLNTGHRHSVYNNGETDRIALMFSLDGQQDLSEIFL